MIAECETINEAFKIAEVAEEAEKKYPMQIKGEKLIIIWEQTSCLLKIILIIMYY